MEYYYTERENIQSDKLWVRGSEARHLSKVLRKSAGEEVYVTDGERNLYKTRIIKVNKDSIECSILEKKYNFNEPDIRVGLFQSLLKNPDRFEIVIEKATELGADEINPVISKNVVSRTRDRQERWQSIALSAMKQSQRCYLPKVSHPITFDEAVKKAFDYDVKLIAHERGEKKGMSRFTNLTGRNSVCVFIGPEGGFSDAEIEKARDSGFKVLNLGSRKFRSETAAIVILGSLFMTE